MTSPCFLIISLSQSYAQKYPATCPASPGFSKYLGENFPGALVVGNSAANAGHTGTTPGLGRSHMQGRGAQLSLWLQLLKPPCPRAHVPQQRSASPQWGQDSKAFQVRSHQGRLHCGCRMLESRERVNPCSAARRTPQGHEAGAQTHCPVPPRGGDGFPLDWPCRSRTPEEARSLHTDGSQLPLPRN